MANESNYQTPNLEPTQPALSPKLRGVRTALQALIGVTLGLFTTVWAVEGVPEAVFSYLSGQALLLFGTSSVFAGLIGYFMNRKK